MFGQQDGEWPRPILTNKGLGHAGHRAHRALQVAAIGQQNGNGFVKRPLLGSINRANSGGIKGIARQSVQRVGGDDDEIPGSRFGCGLGHSSWQMGRQQLCLACWIRPLQTVQLFLFPKRF